MADEQGALQIRTDYRREYTYANHISIAFTDVDEKKHHIIIEKGECSVDITHIAPGGDENQLEGITTMWQDDMEKKEDS